MLVVTNFLLIIQTLFQKIPSIINVINILIKASKKRWNFREYKNNCRK